MGMSQAQQPLDWEWDYNVKSVKCMMMNLECFHLRLKEVYGMSYHAYLMLHSKTLRITMITIAFSHLLRLTAGAEFVWD